MTSFWSGYIILITIGSLIGMTWILFANRKRPSESETTDATTGHSSDGIEELDNPLPFWWFLMFVLSIVFAVGYLLMFPGLGSFKGLLGWTQIERWQNQMDAAETRYGPIFARYAGTPIEELIHDGDALKMGQRIFANNCAQCHGSDARGAVGFPNLSDKDWMWGGSIERIHSSISEGRQGIMPPWGTALGEEGVQNVAVYVQSLSGLVPADDAAMSGAGQYQAFCSACHGQDGNGNPLLGAPNLTDDIWLYGSNIEAIKQGIREGRSNTMPAQKGVISDDKIHLLTAYVVSLSAN